MPVSYLTSGCMRFASNAIKMIEDGSRLDNMLGACLRLFFVPSISDKLWTPFKIIIFNSINTGICVFALYIMFCVVYLPLYLASYAISAFGSLIVLLLAVVIGLRSLARTLIFPGSSTSVQQEVSQDFLRRLCVQLELFSRVTSGFMSTLLRMSSGRAGTDEIGSDQRVLSEILNMPDSLDKLSQWIFKSYECLANSKVQYKPEELIMIQNFRKSVSEFSQSLSLLRPYLKTANSKVSYLANSDKEFIPTLFQVLQSSENVKASCAQIKPKKSTSQNFLNILSKLVEIKRKPSAFNKFSFFIMKEQLYMNYKSHGFTLVGRDKNSIDCLFISSASTAAPSLPVNSRSSREDHLASSVPSAERTLSLPTIDRTRCKGLVLFCNPNAGYFECVSQSPRDSSWLGYYLSLDMALCFFNYRGYNESTGVPTPRNLQLDGLTVLDQLRESYPGMKILVHGESIGGMVACYLARHRSVDLLVVDRSFATLDCLAGRLLGGWAKIGLTLLSFWDLCSYKNYLLADCPKAIIQVTRE